MFGIWAKKSSRNSNSSRIIHSDSLLFCCAHYRDTGSTSQLTSASPPKRAVLTSRTVNRVLKIENNFKSYFSACLGIFSMSTFDK